MEIKAFPKFDDWIISTYPGIISFNREEIASLHCEYEKKKLAFQEGMEVDETQTHEAHE